MTELADIVHDGDFFRNGFINLIMIGKSGCGKSYLTRLLVNKLSPAVRTIAIATSVTGVPFHDSILQEAANRGCQPIRCHDVDFLMKQIKQCHDNKLVTASKPGLLIFDDFTDVTVARGPCYNAMTFAATKLRNQGWLMIFITQDPARLPVPVRSSSTAQIFFDSYSRSNLRLFMQDIIDRIPDGRLAHVMIQFIRQQPYRYIMTRQYPFDICVGKGAVYKKVADERDIEVPTVEAMLYELGVDSLKEMEDKTKRLQRNAGNTSGRL